MENVHSKAVACGKRSPERVIADIQAFEPDEVRQVMRRSAEEFPGRDDSRIRLGQTEAGRYLQVVYVPDAVGDGAFVVTAYDLTPKAKRAFRKRQRRKKK